MRAAGREYAVGISLSSTPEPIELAQYVESLGLDYVTSGEHVLFPAPTRNALMVLAAAAGATSSVGLVSAATIVPLYPPMLLAKMIAVLDEVSEGRFELGVGVGGEYPPEFEALGVPLSERGARTDEALELLKLLFTADRVSFEGRFNTVEGVSLTPRPSSALPVWIGGRSDASIRRAAKYGDYWCPYLYTPERLAKGIERLRILEVAEGREAGAVRAAVSIFVSVDRNGSRAQRWAVTSVGGFYNQDFSSRGSYFVAGTPQECQERLLQFLGAGAQALLLHIRGPADVERSMLELLVDSVLP